MSFYLAAALLGAFIDDGSALSDFVAVIRNSSRSILGVYLRCVYGLETVA